jgi:hypothetical protein
MYEKQVERVIQACVAGAGSVAVRLSAESLFEAGGKLLLAEGAKLALRQAVAGTARGLFHAAVPAGLGELAHEGVRRLTTAAEALSGAASGAGSGATSGVALGAAEAASTSLASTGFVASRQLAMTASKQILKGAGKAAGVGLVVDGVFGGIQAASAYRKGEMTGRQAAVHVVREASTGAVATGFGVAVAAGLVAVTGGLGAPVVFAVGAGSSIGAKQLLRRLVG